MDTEKSSNSSFEDLSINLNESDIKTTTEEEKSDGGISEDLQRKSEESAQEDETCDETTASGDDDNPCDILGNGQLMYHIVKKAQEKKRPSRGDLVTISFTGRLADGTVIEKEDNLQVHVGDFEVVQGLDMALPIMSVDEIAELTVDPRFAYGSIGFKNEKNPEMSVPPHSTIIYEVHMLDMKTEDFADLKSFEVRRNYGTRKKERANFWYNRNEFNTAIQLYRRALDFLDDRDGDPDSGFDKENLEKQTLMIEVCNMKIACEFPLKDIGNRILTFYD